MSKIIFFFMGLIGGIALGFVLYLQASGKYNTAQNMGVSSYTASEMKTAQLIWPPYMLDSAYQAKLRELTSTSSTKGSGPNVTIYISPNATAAEVEELINELEVMDGVEEVVWSTLDDPVNYIKNMTALPTSDEHITDFITVNTDSSTTAQEVKDISEVKDFVLDVTSQK